MPLFGTVFPDSISATYYNSTCIVPFMIILGAAGLLLISYSGYDRWDNFVCTAAGIFGLLICLFPCNAPTLISLGSVGTFMLPVSLSGKIHNISAIFFFGLLAYNSLFLFTKSNGVMTEKKKKRNIIFRVCGIGMVVSLALMIPVSIIGIWGGTWFVETLALAFFGVSWLTKANVYPWLFAEKD